MSAIPEGSEIDWKALHQALLEPETDDKESLMYMDKGGQSRRNQKRISYIARELSIAMLARTHQETGTRAIWNKGEDRFASPPYCSKSLSCEVSLVTGRDTLQLPRSQIVMVAVGYEWMRDGREYEVIDGIEFHGQHGPIGHLGRRHDHQDFYYIEPGEVFAGFVGSLSHEGFIALRLIKTKEGITNEAELKTSLISHNNVEALSLSPEATLHSFKATFLGVSF